MGWIGCVHCEKLWCDFVARTSSLIAQVQPILYRVPCSNETLPNAPKHYEMLQNMSLVPMGWIECVLCEKFRCDFMAQTCALIAPVQPVLHRVSCSNKTLTNAPKHYENTPKHEFRVQWGGSRAFVAKNSMRFRTTNFCIYVQPVLHQVLCSNETNPKCTQTVRNTPILQFRVQWGGSGVFVAKNCNATSWHKLVP